MIKRTFVLFFYLLALLVLPVRHAQSAAMPEGEISCAEPAVTEEECHDLEDGLICEEDCLNNVPIIQAHEAEWKENLSNLLRHRHSSYRFVTFESVTSSNFIFSLKLSLAWAPAASVSYFTSLVTLPDYYNFLHRLCPF